MDNGRRSLPRTLFDAEVSAAVATLVVLGIAHCLRATILPDTLAAIHADQPPLRRGESLAVLVNVERLRPAGERLTVVRLAKLPVLLGMDEFVPHRLAELLPAKFLVGVPGEPNRDRFSGWVVFGDAGLSLRPLGNLPVDRFNGEFREVLGSDGGRVRSHPVDRGVPSSFEKK